MSHASLICALSPEDLAAAGGDVHAAVSHQMEPFDEQGVWGGEGTRWDWWTIGGRYTGKLTPGYDPEKDPRNIETCWLCNGTGRRNDEIGREHRRIHPEYTCNGCSGVGKSVKLRLEKHDGDVRLRSELQESDLIEGAKARTRESWAKFMADVGGNPERDASVRSFIYGYSADDTEESVVAHAEAGFLTAYAFLKNRTWYECGRLGMFAMPLKSECTIQAEERGETYDGRCIFKHDDGSRIVGFEENETEGDEARWRVMYWPRFIRNLPPETTLVVVDYHC